MLSLMMVIMSCCGDGGYVDGGSYFPWSGGGGGATCPISLSSCVSGTLAESHGGTGAGALTCSSGQCLTSNGSAYSCTSTITASAVSCSGCVANGALGSSYSGVGSCGSHLWASTLNANAAPTCTQIAYSDLSGSPIASGSSPQIQYNNSGVLGGLANVSGDGTHELYAPEAVPAAPGASNSLAFDLNGLQSGSPMRIDFFMAVPMPVGFYRTGGMSFIGSSANWYFCQNYCSQWNSTSFDVAVGCLTTTFTGEGGAGSGGGWASTSLATRLRHVDWSTTTSQNWVGGHRGNLDDGQWVGNSAGIGGFIFHTRFAGNTHQTGDMTFAGVAATAAAFTNGSRPAQQLNSAYVGCDSTDTNLQVCSNDGTTTSCTTTSASFPCRTNSTFYDVQIEMPPHAALPDGGTGFVAYIERLDSAATIQVTKTGNMPTNTVQLSPHVVLGSSDAGGTNTTKIDLYDLETWSNL